jgi:XTP/dITP diphosphohydrolase
MPASPGCAKPRRRPSASCRDARGRAIAQLALILATRNEHKLREVRRSMPEADVRALPDGVELPPETGQTFAANALDKARAARAATGEATIADDSGIEVAALGGAPGVRSARFAGEDADDELNLALLLERMEGVSDRRAAYVCALAYIAPDGEERLFEARCEGTLAGEPRGEHGFGYDPAFVPDATGAADERTMAELDPGEKDAISHRGQAVALLCRHLRLTAGAPR